MEAQSLSEQEKPEPWARPVNLHFKECGWKRELANQLPPPEPKLVSRPVSEDLKGLPGIQVEPALPRDQCRDSSVEGSPQGLPQAQAHLWVSGEESSIQALVLQKNEGAGFAMQETWFDPWVSNIPCRKEWPRTPVFLPGEFHGQRNLVGYIVHGVVKSWT